MARRTTAPVVDELNSVGISTAARVLEVSRPTIYAWIQSGKIAAYPHRGTRAPTTGEPALRVLIADVQRLRRERRAG